MKDLTRSGVEQFMTVDAFDVELTEGTDSAVVTKDHSGPMSPQGRTAPEHARAIAREITWLTAAAEVPGVVRLAPSFDAAKVEAHQRTDCVRTVYGGGRTLRSDCPDELSTAVVLADVSRTLATLEANDLIHGSVTPEHIIVRPDLSTLLCSPNTSNNPVADLVALGRCIEFATEQWASPSTRIEQWLVLAKRLRDSDPTLSPERVAHQLEALGQPAERARRLPARIFAGLALAAATAVFGAVVLASTAQSTVSGPEVEVDGLIVQVGERGQIAVARPSDSCGVARVYLLDPITFRIWSFEEMTSGHTGTALAMVPGATDLQLIHSGECATVLAKGPAGSVTLE